MKATSFNPYEPPQEIRTSPQPGDHRSWYRDACVYGLPLELVCSSVGVVLLLLLRVPLIHAMIETQACILVVFASVSVFLLLLFGKHGLPVHITTSVCIVAGWIVIVGWVMLTGNWLQNGFPDEQMTFYMRVSGKYGIWHWLLSIAAVGFFPVLLGFSRVRRSLMLVIPSLLMTVLFATVYAWHTKFGLLVRFF